MCKVGEILQEKGSVVHSIGPNATVMEALKLMSTYNIGVVLVVEADKILGIFSERDCVSTLAEDDGHVMLQEPIWQHMTSPVYYVTPDQTLEDCMSVMTAKNIRHLPVINEDSLQGMISIGDVVKTIILEKDENIKDLENYLWVNMI